MMMGFGFMGFFAFLFWIGLLVLLGAGAVWAVRQLQAGTGRPLGGEDPLEVARRRLAAGEITVEEYERIRQELER